MLSLPPGLWLLSLLLLLPLLPGLALLWLP
jgi:hypothetical protein